MRKKVFLLFTHYTGRNWSYRLARVSYCLVSFLYRWGQNALRLPVTILFIMNLLIIADYWLDISAILLGIVSTIVAVFHAIRIMEREKDAQSAGDTPLFAPSIVTASSRPSQIFSPAPARESFTEKEILPQLVAEHNTDAPQLEVSEIKMTGLGIVRLLLKNVGGNLVFDEMELGDCNEMEVAYTPPIHRELDIYTTGSVIPFTLRHKDAEAATYQFVIRYKDVEGRSFSQEVAGMGAECPILEPVETISPVPTFAQPVLSA